jgi:hypothetical protein
MMRPPPTKREIEELAEERLSQATSPVIERLRPVEPNYRACHNCLKLFTRSSEAFLEHAKTCVRSSADRTPVEVFPRALKPGQRTGSKRKRRKGAGKVQSSGSKRDMQRAVNMVYSGFLGVATAAAMYRVDQRDLAGRVKSKLVNDNRQGKAGATPTTPKGSAVCARPSQAGRGKEKIGANLDGSKGWHTAYREENQFGSHPAFDDYGDESES